MVREGEGGVREGEEGRATDAFIAHLMAAPRPRAALSSATLQPTPSASLLPPQTDTSAAVS